MATAFHQVLAAPNGALMAPTPLTLAETASVFGEMLTFRALLAETSADPAERKSMLAAKVEDMLNTVVRQIAFYTFERRVHLERRAGELTAEPIGAAWMSVQAESLGPAIGLSPGYETFWAYIGHFIHSPFYVYAYAFGDCLVNSLYGLYERTPEGFAERYLAMLAAGGSKSHRRVARPVRPRRERSGLLGHRAVGDRADDRRTGGDGVGRPYRTAFRKGRNGQGSARRASDLLARCWREGQVIDALPLPSRPVSRAEGYAIQAEIEALSEKPLFGWKIAATSVAGQKHIGVDGPLAGRLLAERVHGDDDEIPSAPIECASRSASSRSAWAAICRRARRHMNAKTCSTRSLISVSPSRFRTRATPTS